MNIHNTTNYIHIDRARCIGCFQCVDVCPKGVLGKVNLPLHKHVHVDHPDQCVGCFACLSCCPAQAIQKRACSK